MSRSQALTTAIQAARAGEEIIRRSYQQQLKIEIKQDRTPVTLADRETEEVIRRVLESAFPEDGFYGEETGESRAEAARQWLVDPIDGTKSFVREQPFFSTQIALRERERFILGVSNAPIFGEMAWAEAGGGAYLNEEPIKVSTIDRLEDAVLSFGNIKTLSRDERWQGLARLVQSVNRTRGYGDFYHYHLVASGRAEVVVESDVHILDVAALSVLVEEAGGRVTDLEGQPLTLESTTIVATNGLLHEKVLEFLS